jgi:hypothetical protein
MKMPYSWKSWVNLVYEFYGSFMMLLKIILLVSELILWKEYHDLENIEQSIF